VVSLGLLTSLVQPERRILIGHQARVRGHPQGPAVHAEHEVENGVEVAAGKQQDNSSHEHQQPDKATAPHPDWSLISGGHLAHHVQATTKEEANDQIVRNRQQPPLH
jgi:hypothetical protein